MAPTAPTFRPAALEFLRGLASTNTRPWFEAHREEYEREVRAPLLDLVDELDARLGRTAPELVGDRRRSVFRIHRDVRFSKDKRPYKTNAACWFYHRDVGRAGTAGGHVHGGAGFYFQLEPGGSMLGAGLWMPPRDELAAIRARVAERHEELERIVTAAAFRRRFGALETEAVLTRVPRGWPADHPAAAWLRYQSFTAGRPLTDDEVLAPGLAERLARDYAALLPLVRWLNGALGLAPAERR
jgi:uncharacterized protein (TIGR02453 family)